MKKIFFIVGVITLIVLGIYGAVSYSNNKTPNDSSKVTIVTTLFPLYDFARSIGQDKVEVSLLLPSGVEAHSFEPTPSDIVAINEADLFVYTGEFMEPWAADIIKGMSGSDVKVVNSSVGIEMIPAIFHDEDEPEGSMDPHVWLDFDNDKIMVDTITAALAEKDPANADFYRKNAADYKNSLALLDAKYAAGLSRCQSKEIVYGGHYAFGYLAKRYNLNYSAAQGASPDSEPTTEDLVALVEQIKKDNIKYVFYEELTTPKIAETLANETQAEMLLLNAAHNVSKEDFENDVTFLSIMEKNLANLKIGLQCSE